MNIGVILPSLELNQLAYEAISTINNEIVTGSPHDYRIFFEDMSIQCINPLCSVMSLAEIWSYSGLLISTTLENTLFSLKVSSQIKRIFYVYDMEWLRSKKDYISNLSILRNPDIMLIARSNECAIEIDRYSNRSPNIIMPQLQLAKLAEAING